MAAVTAMACRPESWRSLAVPVALLAGSVAARRDRPPWRALVVIALVGFVAHARADAEWARLQPTELGTYSGWIEVVGDPQPVASATRVIVDVGGERYEHWARGRAAQQRVRRWRSGERLLVTGERSALDDGRQQRVAWQHVVGQFDIEWVADVAPPSPLGRASNRVRSAIEAGASAGMPDSEAALFRGLVIGDDRDQPTGMIDRFRASGLSHLTAVSGQNVAFVLAAGAPLIRRLRPMLRWAATLGLIGWFVALTRFEPSIVRAGVMAGLSATAFVLGRERAPARLLSIAVVGLLLVDPLLVVSVGFWLSVGATAGVTTVGPWLARRLHRLGPVAEPLGVTLGAQVGVLAPAWLVFGGVPLVSIPANLLAVPVAGAVMLYGLPAALVAGAVPTVAPVVLLPCRAGVRWIDTVATLAATVEPGGSTSMVGWIILLCAVAIVAASGR